MQSNLGSSMVKHRDRDDDGNSIVYLVFSIFMSPLPFMADFWVAADFSDHKKSKKHKMDKKEKKYDEDEDAKRRQLEAALKLVQEAKSGKDKKEKKEKKQKKDKKEKKKKKKEKKEKKRDSSDSDSEESESESSEEEDLAPGQIGKGDYFLKSTEFRVWLKEHKGKFFDDQTTKENKKHFVKFCRAWNEKKLEQKYYDGIHKSGQDTTVGRTKHTWAFAKNLDGNTKMELDSMRDNIEYLTNKDAPVEGMKMRTKPPPSSGVRNHPLDDDPDRARINQLQSKAPWKAYNRHDREVMDELAPKATGREALIEKRKEVGAKIHGAAKAREEDRDGLGGYSEDRLMGTAGNDSFKAAVARRDAFHKRKNDERADRVAEIQQKEDARMKAFMASMGITPGQKIVMRERD